MPITQNRKHGWLDLDLVRHIRGTLNNKAPLYPLENRETLNLHKKFI